MIKVADLMTRSPHTLLRHHTLADAKNMMTALHIRHIPIVDAHQHLLGVVTQRDLLAAQDSSLVHHSMDDSFTQNTPLYEIMHTNTITADPRAGLRQSALQMQKHKIGCLPVVEKGRLVGIITDSDFVAIAINLLELQEENEPEEVDTEAGTSV
ncbi:CBS domain-containing protein [Vibrio sp. SM6]|uniref:CBS domain-containing protein n=1 Tax=Vibrio agarilyticus TaxID=2726741 RepID=A0A7X8TT06_9VIBR|nr:CBS domain-containing protein [Vibrio agarilyticus]NLS14265.1 CBS domain-containing protein [Vibrio agarilyticus]